MNISEIKYQMGEFLLNVLHDEKKDMAELLIRGGADINSNKNNILKKTITMDYLDILKLLVEKGINFDSHCDNPKEYVNYLLLSIKLNRFDIGKYLLLLKNNKSEYVFDISSGEEFLLVVEKGYIELVKLFIDRQINLDITNNFGENAFYLAFKNNHLDMAKLLLSHYPNKNSINNNATIILKNRIKHNDTDSIIFLLQNDIDINIPDTDDITPFVWSLQLKKINIAKLFIQYRPINHKLALNVNASDGYAIIDAINRNDYDFVLILLENGADVIIRNIRPLEIALNKGKKAMVELLIDHINKKYFDNPINLI